MLGVPAPAEARGAAEPPQRAASQSRVNRAPTRASTALAPPGRSPQSGTRPTPAAEADNVPLGWAEEEEAPPKRTLSPIVLVGVALMLMVSVYIGATMLMK
jgi:hypothetical protein